MEQTFDDEISLKELLQKLQGVFRYLLAKWVFILLIAITGATLGFFLAVSTKPTYTARMTFVAEEGKSMGGGLASLAGQFGLDFGGGGSGGGIFSGENLLLFLKSESLIRETLLTSYDSTKKMTLADKYAQFEDYQEEWNDDEIGSINFFKYANRNLPRKEDSLLQVIITDIGESLIVSKPDKKASLIEVKITTKGEWWSKIFVERLVATGTQRYVNSKIKVKADNVALLQKRADSLGSLLNSTTYSAAVSQQILVDVNPALRTAPVNAEISTRQKVMLSTIFAEVVKNLELAKFSLSQETPVIQVVDRSYLPLVREKPSKLLYMLSGGFLAGFLVVLYLLIVRWWRNLMNEA